MHVDRLNNSEGKVGDGTESIDCFGNYPSVRVNLLVIQSVMYTTRA